MSASSSAKHPSLLHTGAPVCQKTGADLQGGGGSPKSEARSRRDSCSTRPPGGHLRGLGFPQSGSPTPGLPPTPCTSFQSPPLPPGSIPFLWVPLPAAATPAPAASRPAPAAPARPGHLSQPQPRRSGRSGAPRLLPPHLVPSAAGLAPAGPASLVPFPSLVRTPCQWPSLFGLFTDAYWGDLYAPPLAETWRQ